MSKKPNYDFGFKKPEKVAHLFTVTDPESINLHEVKNIQINKLVPFKNHPFKLYEGKRFDDMCESIKENGVLVPIIVRLLEDDSDIYEILSGHNRMKAAKAIGLEFIPAIIRDGLTDEEAMLIVTETNLIQRSFSDLSHSERAITLSSHHEAIKSQGKRTDRIKEIENLLKNHLNISENGDNQTFSQVGKKLNNVVKLGEDYGLSKNSIARYLRINKLIDALKIRLDNGEFGIVPAVEISYLSKEEQTTLNNILDENKYKVDIKKAEMLRDFSKNKKLTSDKTEKILSENLSKKQKSKSPASFKIKYNLYIKYFKENMKQDEVESIIDKALEKYFKDENNMSSEN